MGIETRHPGRRLLPFVKLPAFVLLRAAALCFAGCSKREESPRNEVSLEELNRAYKSWGMARGSYASDLNELTNFPALQGRQLPKLPPGKKLAIDPNTHQISIADQ
jgi:hypothetical protein